MNEPLDERAASSQRKRRRWYQFSLATLLLATAAVAGVNAWLARRAAEQRRTSLMVNALETYIATAQQDYNRTNALFQANALGGEAQAVDACGRELWSAKAELALLQGDRGAAVGALSQALTFADKCVLDMSANSGVPPRGSESIRREAAKRKLEIELKLAELAPDVLQAARKDK